MNLLSNAFDAVHRPDEPAEYEPLVSVITRKLDDEVQIEIRDNGPGISPDIADRVFKPFFTTKPAGSGTGLGLSLSYDIIVQAYGGSLTFNSSPEKGTGFVVCLPSTR